jgi:hypothetical protein
MKISKFFKLLPDFVKNIDVNGIIIRAHEDEYLETLYRVTGERFEVPIFTIYNPQDLPYTKEAILEFLLDEITKFSQFVSADFIGVKNLIQFDNSVLDIYIPKRVDKEISECLKSVNFNKVIYTSKANYRVEGQFTGNYWFEIDGDGIVWWVVFKPIKISFLNIYFFIYFYFILILFKFFHIFERGKAGGGRILGQTSEDTIYYKCNGKSLLSVSIEH